MDNVLNDVIPTDDQSFLLYFIMGAYFAPDLKEEGPTKSILQRRAEGLPLYTFDQLAGSHIKAVEVERIYSYVLRKADPSVMVKLAQLHEFFHGNLPTLPQDPTIAYPQFDDLFPPHLHPHSWFKNKYKIIGNIVFINKPETYYMKTEDIERFKRITGLGDLVLDRDSVRLYIFVDGPISPNVAVVQEVECNGELDPNRPPGAPRKIKNLNELTMQLAHAVKSVTSLCNNGTPPVSSVPSNDTPTSGSITCNGTPLSFSNEAPFPMEVETSSGENLGPGMIFLPSRPTKEEFTNIVAAIKKGYALTGSAAMGQIGPVLGLMDIGECEDSYLFRVSLPGVKRDEREFSCEVENDGKVLIRGVTVNGEKTVCRYSQTFEMQSQNLCPPGHFSISFKLPGPVDPRQFSGNFGTDGILEGIVMKEGQNR